MDQPAVPAASPGPRRKSRVRFWVTLGLAAALLCAIGGFFVFRKMMSFIGDMAAPSWAVLHEAAEAVQTEDGARAFYREHRGLWDDYRSVEEFVEVSRGWAPKLKTLPATMPDLWTLAKAGGQVSVNQSSGTTHLHVRYRDVTARVSLQGDKLVDLAVE